MPRTVQTYSCEELQDISQECKSLPDVNGLKAYYDGICFKKRNKEGIHYWNGFPYWSEKDSDYRYIAILDQDVTESSQEFKDFMDPDGRDYSEKVDVEYTPCQGLIQLCISPYNRSKSL